MIISNEGRVIMGGTQADILVDFDMVARSIRKGIMDGDFNVKEDKKDELLHLIADETAKTLLGDEEEKEPDGIAEELEKEVENFMDRILGKICGEEK